MDSFLKGETEIVKDGSIEQYSIFLERIDEITNNHAENYGLLLDFVINDIITYNRLDLCQITFESIEQLINKYGNDIIINLDPFRYWSKIIKYDKFGFIPIFEHFNSFMPKVNDFKCSSIYHKNNYFFYKKNKDSDDVPTIPIYYYLIYSLNSLLYLEDKFATDYKQLFSSLTTLDEDLYNHIRTKIGNDQYLIDHIDQLFLIKNKNVRTRELISLGITEQYVIGLFNNYDVDLSITSNDSISKLPMKVRLLYNLVSIDDDDTISSITQSLPIGTYYWILNHCVQLNSIKILRIIDKLLLDKITSQYGLFLPNEYKSKINTIISEIKNTPIFNYMFDKHKEIITIHTYNILMYETSYVNNFQIFKVASKFGNDWDNSWYEATRCGNKEIIEYIRQTVNPPTGTSFQECFADAMSKINKQL